MKTATDLASQIGKELLLVVGNEELAGEDNEFIKDLSESYHETLQAYQVNVTWDHENIPLKVFIPLARVLAGVAAPNFGDALPEAELRARMQSLKAASAFPFLGEPGQAEYL